MARRANEYNNVREYSVHGQKIVEMFDRVSGKKACIIYEPDGTVKETGSPRLLRVLRLKKPHYIYPSNNLKKFLMWL